MYTVHVDGLEQAVQELTRVDNGMASGIRRAMYRIGALIRRRAKEYAPISPTITMLKAFRKNLKKGGEYANVMSFRKRGGGNVAVKLTAWYEGHMDMLLSDNPRATNRAKPGALQTAITFQSDSTRAEIFVPANSEAGKYAYKIHEERGITWKHLGPGSQAKGPQAREKFIERAIEDNEPLILQIVDDETAKALGRI